MDIMSKKKRSEVMSKIRSKETKCEIALRKALYSKGIRGYRKNLHILGFEVDLAFPKKKIVVFCDSDFWHGRKNKFPKTNREYWIPKLKRNIERDKMANKILGEAGWDVIRLLEEDILNNSEKEAEKIIKMLETK